MMSRRVPSGWRLLPLVGLMALMAAPAAPAQERGKAAASLEFVPADVMYYGVSLRNREQLEAVLKSKAWAKLKDLPFAKLAWQKVVEGWNQPGGPQTQLKEWYEQDENRELVRLLGAMFSDEVFSYGGPKTANFLALLGQLQAANQLAPFQALLQGKNPQEAQTPQARARALLQALNDNPDLIVAPDLVMGFKLRDTAPAKAQLARLDKLVQALEQMDERFKGRWNKAKVAGGEFYTLKLDGEMVPWDQIPWGDIEDEPGQFDKLKKKLRELKLTVSVGLRDQFLIVSLAENTALLEALGRPGKRLADRKEFAPLAKFADRKLTAIGYASKEWQALQAGQQDGTQAFEGLLEMLKNVDLTPKQQAKIKADLEALKKDFDKPGPEAGPALSFTFLTGRGSESYTYAWTKALNPAAVKPLTILQQVGGAPLLFAAGRSEYDPEEYKLFVKWLKIAWGYAEEFGFSRLPEDAKEKYDAVMKEARPLLARLEKVTGELLNPALAEGQGALVIDAKLKSKQWHQMMPASPQDLAVLEPAVVLGVADAAKLKKAGAEYRDILNKLIAVIGVADVTIPPPQTKAVKGGTLYYYAAPDAAGLDPQLALTAGVTEKWAVFTISPGHATRLLQPTPLTADNPRLKAAKGALSASYFSWEGLVDAVMPWVDYGLTLARPNDGEDGMDVRGQVRTVLAVLKVFRNTASVTTIEGDAVVTHSESIVRDIE